MYTPGNLEELRQLVQFALANDKVIRVRGAGHSASRAVFDDASIPVQLIRNFMTVTVNSDNTVTAGGGCFIGHNPFSKFSIPEKSLVQDSLFRKLLAYEYLQEAELNKRDRALRVLGGMDHQTVAGFLQTASAGGSFYFNLGSDLLSLEILNGNNTVCSIHQ